MSGRLKKAQPRLMARTSGSAVVAREDPPWPKRSRPRRMAASNTALLCAW
jgi:hypothetical protein